MTGKRNHGKNLCLQALGVLTPFWGFTLINVGCGSKHPHQESEVTQLTEKPMGCQLYPSREQEIHLSDMPPRFINSGSFRVNNVENVKNHLTGIPRKLLGFLYSVHATNGFNISERNSFPGAVGVTYFVRGFRGENVPTKIEITPAVPGVSDPVHFALQHEVGHAVENFVKKNVPSAAQIWQGLFQAGRTNVAIRPYARSTQQEFFAETFNNFYCSPEANEFLKAQLPRTHAELSKILPPPRWEETATGEPPLEGREPSSETPAENPNSDPSI